MNQQLKRILSWLGRCFAVLGIVFVYFRLRNYQDLISDHVFENKDWVRWGAYTVLYGVFSLLLGLSWRYVLEYLGSSISKSQAITIYGVTQISKYVPGNIIHLAGRQSMGMAAGIKAWSLVKSTIWEFGLLIGISLLFGLFTVPTFLPGLQGLPSGVLVVFLLSFGGALLGILRYDRSLGYAFLGYGFFLLLTGFVFFLILSDLSSARLSWAIICGAYIIAWLIGLVTPGAPAGIGIREWVLLFLLVGLADEGDVLLAVLLARVVSVGGDILFFLFASGLRMRSIAMTAKTS